CCTRYTPPITTATARTVESPLATMARRARLRRTRLGRGGSSESNNVTGAPRLTNQPGVPVPATFSGYQAAHKETSVVTGQGHDRGGFSETGPGLAQHAAQDALDL